MNSYAEYRSSVLKLKESRQTKKTKTFHSKYIIRNIKRKHLELKSLPEDVYSKMIRRINELLIEELLQGKVIKFPYLMGSLSIYSNESKMYLKDNKLIKTAPVKWNETLKLWYADTKAKDKKVLIKDSYIKIYKVVYKTRKYSYKNRIHYKFKTCRSLKNIIKNTLNNNINIPSYEHTIYYY